MVSPKDIVPAAKNDMKTPLWLTRQLQFTSSYWGMTVMPLTQARRHNPPDQWNFEFYLTAGKIGR
ncbi:hypothetical protein CFP56_009910 [Quercus suber]|uniref:Uncharacterized protein n=1 Tax=Quercus suber TaxID=58331 RepID=A0AAW0L041_QUESU